MERYSHLRSCDPELFREAVHFISEVCESPLALVSMVDRESTRLLGSVGIGLDAIDRHHSFCHHAFDQASDDGCFVVEDTRLHDDLKNSKFVHSGEEIRFYAGFPYLLPNGHTAGFVAMLDTRPRTLEPRERNALRRVARLLTRQIRRESSDDLITTIELPHESTSEILKLDTQLQLYREIFERTSESVAIISPDGSYLAQNPAHREMIGYSEEDLSGETPAIHLGDKCFAEVAKALEETGHFEGEVDSQIADGTILRIHLSAFSVKDSDGEVICHVGLKRDVTVQRETEQALAESMERLELSVKGSRDGLWDARVYSFDLESPENLVSASRRCFQLLGSDYSESRYTAPWVFRLVHPDDRALAIAGLRDHIMKGQAYDVDLRMRVGSGGYRWFNARGIASGQPGKDPWPIRLAGSLRDITEQKELEEKLLETKQALESRVEERTSALRAANKDLHREVDERKRAETVQRLLYQISEAAANTASLPELCRSIHDSLGQVIDATNFYIGLYQPELKTISIPYQADERDTSTTVTPEEFAETFTARVIETNEPLFLTESQMKDATDRGDVGVVGTPCKAWLGVPLRTKNRLVGAVVVQSYTDPVAYTEDDLAMMGFIATQIANVLERRQAQEELRRTEQQLSLHFQQTPLAVILADVGGIVMEWNPSAERSFGYSRDQAVGRQLSDLLVPPDRHEKWNAFWKRVLNTPAGFNGKFRNRTKDGQSIYCEWYNNPLIDESDNVIAIASLVHDVTDRVRAEEALRVSEERFALAVRGANDGIWDWNLSDNHVYFSPRWKEMLGLIASTVTNTPGEWFSRVHDEDLPALEESIDKHLTRKTPHFECEYRMMHDDGEYRWMLARGLAVQEHGKTPTRIAGSQTDITAWKRAQQQILHAATHDSLTGLPNRALFMDRLRQSIHRLKRHQDFRFALLFLDLDRFKIINDTLGHVTGDQLLRMVAERLQFVVRPQDTIARFGGDEFTVLLDGIADVNDAKLVADRLLEQFNSSFRVRDNDLYVSASIGIVLSPRDAEEPEELLRNADMAMYQAKGQGKASHLVFDEDMQEQVLESLRIETDLRRAVERHEFTVHWQPIFEISTGTVVGVESLVRWNHPEKGLLTPRDFLAVAEDSGIINRIGQDTIDQSLRAFSQWCRDWPDRELWVSINLSASQLLHGEIEQVLVKAANAAEVNLSSIQIETSEKVIAGASEQIIESLERLSDRGFKIVLGGFGSGFGSLKHLDYKIFDSIKLHPSFYRKQYKPDDSDEILGIILHVVEHLGMTIIAESVDDPKAIHLLKQLPCRYVQGYEFSPVVGAEEIDRLLHSGASNRT